MLLAELCETSRRVTESSGRLDKVAELVRLLSLLRPDEAEIGVLFLSGELRQGKIGVGYATIASLGVEPATEASLSLLDVDRALEQIAAIKGAGSSTRRTQALGALFQRATGVEQDFLRRLLVGELRQGALEGVMVDAVARAYGVSLGGVRRALMLSGQMAAVVRSLVAEGARGLEHFRVQLFRPLQPMLAQSAESVDEALGQLERVSLEYKLDGARIQVHREADKVRIYTRSLNDVTERAPEIVSAVRALPVKNLVLDGEAISLRPDGTPRPFQTTMSRFGSRSAVERLQRAIPLQPMFFDCLHLEGDDLIDRPAEERISALGAVLPTELQIPRLIAPDSIVSTEFLERALKAGHEGIVAKSLASAYEAGRRGASWLKVKPAHTLDLVVLAVEWGSGRRRGWLSNIHLGARDPATGGFAMLGKTFKGMTDEMLRWQTERFLELEVARDAHTVYVRPELVVEVAFDGVQKSPHYASGLALRFARVKRYRADKRAEQSDTIETVRTIYARQSVAEPIE